jgi:hypothetical protein
MVCAMGKARRKSTAPIPFVKAPAAKQLGKASAKPITFQEACERAAKRLDVDDVDYAERQLCQVLARPTMEFGRDWFASQVEPKGADVTELWQHFGYTLVVDRSMNKATFKRPFVSGIDMGFENVTAHKIRIAPAVIDALAPVSAVASVPKPKRRRKGRRQKYDAPRLKRTMREIAATAGQAQQLEGKGGIADKLRDRLGEDAVPGRSWLYKIFESIFPPKESSN